MHERRMGTRAADGAARAGKRKLKLRKSAIFLALLALFALGAFRFGDCVAEPEPEPAPQPLTAEEKARKILAGMTLEEKAGQIFLVVPEAVDDCGHEVTEQCLGFKENQAKYNVGGIILFGSNLQTPQQTRALLASFQKASKYPLFLAVDEEGGDVARVGNNPAMRELAPKLPPMQKVKSAEEARQIGRTMGKYLADLGFNLDFAPVADVLIDPRNAEIGNRSFGQDAQRCGELAAEVAAGLQEEGVGATLKHFPGHGGFESNSHRGISVSQRTLADLQKTEFVAFRKGMAAGAACVMVAHLSLPQVLGDDTPATLSEKIVSEILKKELGFQGLVVSDALNMGAIANYYGAGKAAVRCLNAGADVLLMPADLAKAYAAVLAGVRAGEIRQERLDDAVYKIVLTKIRLGIWEQARKE